MSSKKDSFYLDGDAAQAAETLRWWIRAGVNSALNDAPHDRFAGQPPLAVSTAENEPSISPPEAAARFPERTAAAPPEAADLAAHALAAQATDLETLRSIMQDFDGCALKRTATQLVFSDGAPGSPIMFVGEAPGGDEDRIGRPFVGRAGQLLDRMLSTIGLDRRQVYIANVIPWRPPGNRTPTLQETQTCLPFIRRQIELADPQLLVCLGGSAAQTLLGVKGGIMRARGSWFAYPRDDGSTIPALAMLHPAYLLRQPAHKRLAWADMRSLASALEEARRRS